MSSILHQATDFCSSILKYTYNNKCNFQEKKHHLQICFVQFNNSINNTSDTMLSNTHYTVGHKKGANLFSSVTLSKINRF